MYVKSAPTMWFPWLAMLLALYVDLCTAMTLEKLAPTGAQPSVTSPQGRVTRLYRESHALLISFRFRAGTAHGP